MVYDGGMSDTDRINPIRARLDPPVRASLDRFCLRTRRSLTQAVNLLLAEALDQHKEARP